MWTPRRTYLYLVCFTTLIMTLIGAVQTVRHALDLALPEAAYVPSPLDVYSYRPAQEADSPYSREEIEAMAEAQAEQAQRSQRRRALRDLLGSLALLGLAVPVYRYHWRRVRGDAPDDPAT